MRKSKKVITKGLSDAELSAKNDNGNNAQKTFDKTLNNMINIPSQSAIVKPKK